MGSETSRFTSHFFFFFYQRFSYIWIITVTEFFSPARRSIHLHMEVQISSVGFSRELSGNCELHLKLRQKWWSINRFLRGIIRGVGWSAQTIYISWYPQQALLDLCGSQKENGRQAKTLAYYSMRLLQSNVF